MATAIESFSELTDLALNGMEKLSDFSALVACENLQVLSINACRKIESYSSLSQLGALEKLRILDSAPIASLALFRELEKLNELIFTGTTIRDGELGHLLKMPNLKECWFRNQHDTELTCDLVRKTLEQRHGPSAALPRRIGPGESVPYALGTDLPPLVDPRGEPIAYREPPPI